MLARAARFFVSTGASAVLGQVLLFVLHAWAGWSAVPANVVAVAVGTAVAFVLSVRFVWPKSEAASRRMQIVVFVLLSVLGLIVSTVLASLLSRASDHALAPNIGSTAGFGLVWVIRFLILDKTVFRIDQGTAAQRV